jgi:uncharacterized protein YbaP (TraB family)
MLESELERILTRLKTELVLSEEYTQTLAITERLHDMMDKDRPSSVSKETLVTVGANLLGIFMIIKHEHVNVITSKALSFVLRPR